MKRQLGYLKDSRENRNQKNNHMDVSTNNNNQQDLPEVPPVGELDAKLGACEAKRDEYLAGWQRAKADFENYKKDEMKRFEEIARYATGELIMDMIGVLDNFDLGIRSLEKAGQVEKGVYMIRAQMEDVLKKRGLVKIPIAIGSLFDPMIAEAIAEGESESPPGSIIEEIEPGYRLFDKVVRPARVRIAKGK